MGIVHPGVPRELVLHLKEQFGLNTFIETGTYHGITAEWASSNFKKVRTIEYSRNLYDQTSKRCGNIKNIDFIYGDTRSELNQIVPALTEPAMFWVDSHFSGKETYGTNDPCPLIEELKAITGSPIEQFIFIDDARFFTAPLEPSHSRIDEWPSISDVIQAIQAGRNSYYIIFYEDVIIAVPKYAKKILADFCRNSRRDADRLHETKKMPCGTGIEPAVPNLKDIIMRGENLFALGDIDGAKNNFALILENETDFAAAYNNLGVLSWQAGNMNEALNHLQKAAAIMPDDRGIVLNYGGTLKAAGKKDEMEHVYNRFLQDNPDDKEICSALSTADR